MNSIVYGEGCFGPFVRIDGESLFSEQEDLKTKEYQKSLINELLSMIDKLDMQDLQDIAKIVTRRGNWNWDATEEKYESCDQCGNYNWSETYTK
jgi:hypothetical protein